MNHPFLHLVPVGSFPRLLAAAGGDLLPGTVDLVGGDREILLIYCEHQNKIFESQTIRGQ